MSDSTELSGDAAFDQPHPEARRSRFCDRWPAAFLAYWQTFVGLQFSPWEFARPWEKDDCE